MEDDVPPTVIGDVTRLRQILVNLISNAIKFTSKGGVTIELKHTRPEPESENGRAAASAPTIELHFAVTDTAIRIPTDKLDRLFKSFSQVDASTTRHYGGTGLGLAIS